MLRKYLREIKCFLTISNVIRKLTNYNLGFLKYCTYLQITDETDCKYFFTKKNVILSGIFVRFFFVNYDLLQINKLIDSNHH